LRSSNLACRLTLAACAAAAVAALAACGSSSTKPSKLSLSISEQGKAASFKAPKSAKGGLVDVTFKNSGKAPHGVQFVQYTGNHTVADVLKQIGSNSNKTPSWLKGNGGTTPVPGGKTGSATVNLPAGNYVLVDSASLGGGSGPPATAPMKVTSGDTGDLPSTPGTVTANHTGKDKYAWDISGLKAGANQVTFNSKGNDTLHLIGAIPVTDKVPPLAKIRSDFAKLGNGPPPSYFAKSPPQISAVLDGGESQTLTLDLKPGKYIFFCPFHDRDGKGKSHDQEGLLKTVTVK
jgi:plastocyanin